MRKALEQQNGTRTRFRAVFERYGTKINFKGHNEATVLFKEVRFADSGGFATDHIWFTVGKTIGRAGLKPGDIVEFDARIVGYSKGYINPREGIYDKQNDYKLSHPTKLIKVDTTTNCT